MGTTSSRVGMTWLVVLLFLAGCEHDPTWSGADTPEPSYAKGAGAGGGGAIVSNSGEGKPDVFCFFWPFATTQGTAVRTPSGHATLSCHFEGLEPIATQETLKGWLCNINQGGFSETRQSQWARSPSGSAHLTCQFGDKPLTDGAVTFGDSTLPAQQGSFTAPLSQVPGQRIAGGLVHIGRACDIDPLLGDPSGQIALIERGTCFFTEKLTNALNAGAIAAIVYNHAVAGEQIITMGGFFNVPIPGVLVAYSTGQVLLAEAPARVTITYCGRSASCRGHF